MLSVRIENKTKKKIYWCSCNFRFGNLSKIIETVFYNFNLGHYLIRRWRKWYLNKKVSMFGANRISKNIFLVSLVLGIFVILIKFASWLKRIAARGKLCTVYLKILDTCIISCLIVGERVKSICTTHFTLSWSLSVRVWFKKSSPFLCIEINFTNPPLLLRSPKIKHGRVFWDKRKRASVKCTGQTFDASFL